MRLNIMNLLEEKGWVYFEWRNNDVVKFFLSFFLSHQLYLTLMPIRVIGLLINLCCGCRRKEPVALHQICKHGLMRPWERLPLDLSWKFLPCPSATNTEQEGRRVSKESGTHYGLLEDGEQHLLLEDLPGKISWMRPSYAWLQLSR